MTERRRGMIGRSFAALGLLAALSAGGACTDAHRMMPEGSTETGNPPVIDTGSVSLVVSANAVHVVGEPGAVTPPEGTVEITVVGTGKKITGMVNPDGSFDVQVDGTLDDVFEVRVVHDGKSSTTVTVMRGEAMVGGTDAGMTMRPPPSAECEELDQRVVNGAAMVVASADTACDDDTDCERVQVANGCGGAQGCSSHYVSKTGKSQIEAGLAQIDSMTCDEFEALGCKPGPVCTSTAVAPACIAGRCKPKGSPDPCTDCDDLAISWRATSPGILPAEIDPSTYAITGCGTLTTTTYDMHTCSAELPGCGVMGSDWKTRLDALLANEDVAAALASGGTHGEPEQFSGIVVEITVRGRTFVFRGCAGHPNRTCEPSGIQDLVEFLWELRGAHLCDPYADCTSPFDFGPNDIAVQGFWHDPASRTCLPRTYGATGGNGNRYMTREDCWLACAPPGADDCGPDRTFAASECVGCGPEGATGCGAWATRCLASCESDADCEGEESNPELGPVSCIDGLCRFEVRCE